MASSGPKHVVELTEWHRTFLLKLTDTTLGAPVFKKKFGVDKRTVEGWARSSTVCPRIDTLTKLLKNLLQDERDEFLQRLSEIVQNDLRRTLTTPKTEAPTAQSRKRWPRIGILDSQDQGHSDSAIGGLIDFLKDKIDPKIRPDRRHFEGPEPADGNIESYRSLVEKLLTTEPDFLVGIGTESSRALHQILKDRFSTTSANDRIPSLIFLGVTAPTDAGLVSQLFPRNDPAGFGAIPVAGVAYARPSDIARRIHELFPQQEIVFLYDERFMADVSAVKELQQGSVLFPKRLSVRKLSQDQPTLKDMPDPKAIYFGWDGLEEIWRNGQARCLKLFEDRFICSVCPDNANPRQLAGMSVAADEYEIGRLGGQIIASQWQNSSAIPLLELPVFQPPLVCMVNCAVAKKFGFSISWIGPVDSR